MVVQPKRAGLGQETGKCAFIRVNFRPNQCLSPPPQTVPILLDHEIIMLLCGFFLDMAIIGSNGDI